MYVSVAVRQPGRTTLWITLVEPTTFGRECDGVLLLDEKVSRRHLRLSPRGRGLLVEDLGSTNGSFVDGMRLTGRTEIAPQASVRIGDTTITIESPPAPTQPQEPADRGGTVVASVGQASSSPAGSAMVKPQSAAADVRRTSMDELVDSLSGDRLNLSTGGDDTVTILFSDIESSTELAVNMGDTRWYQVLTWHNELIERRVASHGGHIVKNQGDGFMITFTSTRRAIICAGEIQQALRNGNGANGETVRVRIGLHTGEAIRQDSGDLFGRHVIIAARIGALAQGGEILVSALSREIVAARGDLHFSDPRMVELKGVGHHSVSSVLWDQALPAS